MLPKKLKNKKKETLLAALISALFLTLAAALIIYSYYKSWTPFTQVQASTINQGQTISITAKTKIPARTRVEYGTSDIYLNSTDTTPEEKTEHSIIVSGVLPERTHYIRLIAYTQDGKEYTSEFYTVD